jgi:aryl-alcohol dehydrogenase-like predicted oxidoreductase
MPFEEAVQMIGEANSAGATLYDVAYYNMGPHPDDSPTDLIWARAIKEAGLAREDYVFSGKLWLWDYPAQDFTEQLQVSLERVGIEKADTAVIGDYMQIDIPAVVQDVAKQIGEGRLDSWGVNNWPYPDFAAAREYAAANGLPLPTFAQLKYGIARRSMAEGAFYGKLFESGEMALQASDTFEGGILAGNPNTTRQIGADPGSVRERIRGIADEVTKIASRFDASPAQLGIAFCLTNASVANVLFGASRIGQLRENLAAVELYRKHGAEIRAAVAHLWVDQSVNADGTRQFGPPPTA